MAEEKNSKPDERAMETVQNKTLRDKTIKKKKLKRIPMICGTTPSILIYV